MRVTNRKFKIKGVKTSCVCLKYWMSAKNLNDFSILIIALIVSETYGFLMKNKFE